MDTNFFVPKQDFSQAETWVPKLEYFVDRSCLPTWRIPRYALWFHDLTWVLAGQATYWCDDQPLTVRAGDLLYLPQGSVRQAITSTSDPMHCLACNFQCRSLEGEAIDRLPFPTKTSIGFPEGLQELYQQLNQVWLEKGSGYALAARGLMTLILHRLVLLFEGAEEGAPTSPRLRLVQNHIVQHYAEPVHIDQLAALVRLHPGYFGTWFRKQTGLTVHQYVNRIRVRKAVDLLSTGGFNVGETADKCGFSDIFHFSKVFRQVLGYPPSDLIRRETPV